jgi:hypothetical protein
MKHFLCTRVCRGKKRAGSPPLTTRCDVCGIEYNHAKTSSHYKSVGHRKKLEAREAVMHPMYGSLARTISGNVCFDVIYPSFERYVQAEDEYFKRIREGRIQGGETFRSNPPQPGLLVSEFVGFYSRGIGFRIEQGLKEHGINAMRAVDQEIS